MTRTEQSKTLEAMKEQLELNRGDIVTISAIADLYEDMEDEQNAYNLHLAAEASVLVNEAVNVIGKQIKELQERSAILLSVAQAKCPHPVTKYYPDPSGNNDDNTTCLCCGAYI